jgi:hypothetical protein
LHFLLYSKFFYAKLKFLILKFILFYLLMFLIFSFWMNSSGKTCIIFYPFEIGTHLYKIFLKMPTASNIIFEFISIYLGIFFSNFLYSLSTAHLIYPKYCTTFNNTNFLVFFLFKPYGLFWMLLSPVSFSSLWCLRCPWLGSS